MRRVGRLAAALVVVLAVGGCSPAELALPICDEGRNTLVLMAQSVPSAALVPCMTALPRDWFLEAGTIRSDATEMTFGMRSADTEDFVSMRLVSRCTVGAAVEVSSDEASARLFEDLSDDDDGSAGTRLYTFDGGCALFRLELAVPGGARTVLDEVSSVWTFAQRSALADFVRERTHGLIEDL